MIFSQRGELKKEAILTFVDLPFMNPMDWINCWCLILIEHQQMMTGDLKAVRDHLKLIIRSYLHLVARVDYVIPEAFGNALPKLLGHDLCFRLHIKRLNGLGFVFSSISKPLICINRF